MCACLYVCLSSRNPIYLYAGTHVCMCERLNKFVCVHSCVYMYVSTLTDERALRPLCMQRRCAGQHTDMVNAHAFRMYRFCYSYVCILTDKGPLRSLCVQRRWADCVRQPAASCQSFRHASGHSPRSHRLFSLALSRSLTCSLSRSRTPALSLLRVHAHSFSLSLSLSPFLSRSLSLSLALEYVLHLNLDILIHV